MKDSKKIKKITSSTDVNNAILGTYEGEILDSNIINKNGIDISAEVIKNVMESEDYRDGIEHGWFIGYLGHPEEPDCMEFKDGCIVMTDMRIEDNGKVYGTFNLVNTPVGSIVKTYIDAGVEFGLSIRGAGDVVGNVVDPETFIFRGFDLVAFPAYPESIPVFSNIAASTNPDTQRKYKAICAAVRDNVAKITSSASIDVLKTQFAPTSEEYKMLEMQKAKLESNGFDLERIIAMTDLYLAEHATVKELSDTVEQLKRENAIIRSSYDRKIRSVERILGSQMLDLNDELNRVSNIRDSLKSRVTILSAKLNDTKSANLIYKQRAESNMERLRVERNANAELHDKLRETVTASSRLQRSTSNLEGRNKQISEQLIACKAELSKCKSALHDFQVAYATIYASATGSSLNDIEIQDSATVDDIKELVHSATNTANIAVAPAYTYADEFEFEDFDDNDLVVI